MILYDPALTANYYDYGILLPIPHDRGGQALDFLGRKNCSFDVLDNNTTLRNLDIRCPAINRQDLERIHDKRYIDELYGNGLETALLKTFELIDEQGKPNRYEPQRANKPLTNLFDILIAQAGGTYLACALVLSRSGKGKAPFCYYFGGGMHHARYDSGAGFCLINDIGIASFKVLAQSKENSMQYKKPVKLIWIIDVDAHKGDGTAELVHFARERGSLGSLAESNILTLSIHMAQGWPLDKDSIAKAAAGRAPLLPSDIDIGIEQGGEDLYCEKLKQGIQQLEQLSGTRPDLAIVVDGADPYEHDGLDSSALLRLTLEQCMERDMLIYRYLQKQEIPSAWIQAGGYGERAWEPCAYFLKKVATIKR